MAKNSKMDLAHKAVVLGNMAEIARNDVESVRKLQAKHLGPEFAMPPKGQAAGDEGVPIVVCDDYHHHHDINTAPQTAGVRPGPNWALVLAVLGVTGMGCLTCLLLGAGWLYMNMNKPVTPPAPVPQPQPATNTTIEKKTGFILDLPGAKR